ncbi:MAG TPA: hypothetical protein VI357_19810 [Mycobacteriales bacterium]
MPPTTVAPPELPPAAAVDVEAVRAAAAGMLPLAQPVADHGDAAVRTWRQIGSCYIAPETPVLLAALDPVGPLAEKSAERIRGLGTALDTFADAAEPIIAELRRLDTGGPVTPDEAARMTALIEHLGQVEQACAAAIRSLTAFDPAPDRFRTGEEVGKASAAIIIGFVKFGQSAVFKKTTFSDGSVFLTAVDGGELSATGSLGGVLEGGAGGKIEAGSTWKFLSAAEADAFQAQLQNHIAAQRAVMFEEGAALGVAAAGGLPPIRPPDLVVSEFAVPVSGKLSGEYGVVQGDAKGEVTVKETVIRDMGTGATTTVVSQEGSGEANGLVTPFGVGPGEGGGVQKLDGSTTGIVRDADGQITKVVLTSTDSTQVTHSEPVAGPGKDPNPGRHAAPGLDPSLKINDKDKGSQVTLTTTTLDVTDDNRAAVEQWAAGGRRDAGFLDGDPRYHNPVTAVPGDDFQNALHDKAKVTTVTYDDVTDVEGFEAKVKAGWTLGVEGSLEETSSHAGEGTYLDAPGPDGTRRPVPIPAPR